MLPRVGLVAFFVAVLGAACTVDTPVTPDASPPECDTSLQDCAGGLACDLICDGTASKIACRAAPPDGGTIGQGCEDSDDCPVGTGCYNTSPTPPTSTCVAYCATDVDCPPGFTCRDRSVSRGCGVAPPTYHVRLCRPM
jgi:hypothetical protein